MKIGIIGLANCGKTTLFNALTGLSAAVTEYPSMEGEPHQGVVRVPEGRVDFLAGVYEPRKITYATVEYVDYLGLIQGDARQNRKVLDMIKDVDAVVHVVRAFEDEGGMAAGEGVDALRDAATVELELIFSDLELVEKRLERMEEGAGKGRKADPAERELLLKCRAVLEGERPLRQVAFSEAEELVMRHLQFISIKPEIMILNVGDDDAGRGGSGKIAEGLQKAHDLPVLPVPGRIEMEISQLSPDEAALFLEDLGVSESAMKRVITFCYDRLDLISFLTVGEDEVRAWTVNKGTSALKAAGKIHSDIERGFIRAEVVAFDDFRAAGSMAVARERGLLRLEGKTYVVSDGDIINFRFNV